MFIGNNSVTLSGNINVQAESAGFMDPVEEALYNVAVDEANYNQILGCLAVAEVTAAHNGLDPASVYTEGTISDFWGKIKEFFKKIWAKIKGLWAKLVATFDRHAKSGQEFFDKYKKTLVDKFTKIDKDKIKFSGYKFSTIDLSSNANADNLKVAEVIKDTGNTKITSSTTDDEITDLEDKYRGTLIGENNSSYTLKEMVKELHDKLRDGGTKDNDMDVDFNFISGVLSGSDKKLRDFDKTFRGLEKTMNKNIRDAEKLQDQNIRAAASSTSNSSTSSGSGSGSSGSSSTTTTNPNDNITMYSKAIRYIKSCLASFQAAAAEIIKAAKDEISQAKGFAAQVLRAGVRDGFKESAGFSSDSIFGMVNLA